MNLRTLPKVELHLHLDCSLSYDVVHRLTPAVTREEYTRTFVAPMPCTNLVEYLSCVPRALELQQTKRNLELITEDLFRQLAADNVVYAEIRFAPLLHTKSGLTPEQVVRIIDAVTERLIVSAGIEARLILCTLRHFTAAQSLATAQLVHHFRGSRVTALDIAGDEAGFPLAPHVEAFRFAREHNLFRTAHAGEALGPESVWQTLRELAPTRIGHGTRSIEDPALVTHLRQQRVHLELCPTSNVQIIPSISSIEEHPLDRLYRAGVALNINTDSRMLTPTTLTREYELAARTFHWTAEDFLATNLMALDAAFLDEPTKSRLRSRIRKPN